MFSSRCGFTARARSKICRTSSIESSWTYVLWLASMKQGEHFRLQRFVRSTIRATPRPVRTVDGPWSCTFVCPAHAKSWPKYSDSIRLKNAGFVESTSSNVPCLAHFFRITIRPDSSMICASITPGSVLKSVTFATPWSTALTASALQRGQSDWVRRGTPNAGVDRSRLFGSGAGAHDGVDLWRSGSARDAAPERCQPAFAAAESKAEPKTCG